MAATHLGGQGARAHGRPGAAARQRARARPRSATPRRGRPIEAFAAPASATRRAVGGDARHQGRLGRADPPPRARRRPARQGRSPTRCTRTSPAASCTATTTSRWSACTSSTPAAATTSSSSTRRRRATRSTCSTRRAGCASSSAAGCSSGSPCRTGRGCSPLASKPFYQVADRVLGSRFLQDIAEFFVLFQTMEKGFVARARRSSGCSPIRARRSSSSRTLEAAPAHEAGVPRRRAAPPAPDLGAVVLNRTLPASMRESAAAEVARQRSPAAVDDGTGRASSPRSATAPTSTTSPRCCRGRRPLPRHRRGRHREAERRAELDRLAPVVRQRAVARPRRPRPRRPARSSAHISGAEPDAARTSSSDVTIHAQLDDHGQRLAEPSTQATHGRSTATRPLTCSSSSASGACSPTSASPTCCCTSRAAEDRWSSSPRSARRPGRRSTTATGSARAANDERAAAAGRASTDGRDRARARSTVEGSPSRRRCWPSRCRSAARSIAVLSPGVVEPHRSPARRAGAHLPVDLRAVRGDDRRGRLPVRGHGRRLAARRRASATA